MKTNRFVALAVIALLVVGAMGFVSTRSYAQTPPAQTVEAPEQQEAAGPDTDSIQEQSGQQVEDGQPDGAEAPGAEDAGPDEQSPSYTGSIAADQAATEGLSEADEAAALAGQAKISVEQAKSAALAANPGASVVKAELDNENGALVYSIELSTGADVKVDAGNGAILHTDTGADSEG